MTSAIGWLAFFDEYGATARIAAGASAELMVSLSAVHKKAVELAGKNDSYFHFGDSFFIFRPLPHDVKDDPEKHCKLFLDFTNYITSILNEGLQYNLLFRGALAFGECITSANSCLGIPVIRCVSVEKKMYLPIAFVPRAEVERAGLASSLPWPTEMIPTKTGLIGGYCLSPQPFGELIDKVKVRLIDALKNGPDNVAAILNDYVKFLEDRRSASSRAKSKRVGSG